MAIIAIEYEEGDASTYSSVSVVYENRQKTQTFQSGKGFVQDWYDMMFWVSKNIEESLMHSSSVNHFIMDGAPYHSAFLDTDASELVYLESLSNLRYRDELLESGIEFFVETGTNPTWIELKTMCGWVPPS